MGNRTQLLGPGGTVTPRRSIPAVFVQPTRPRCGATDGGLVVQQGLVTLKKGRRAQRRMRPGRSHRSGVASSQRCPSGEPIDQHVKEQPDLGAQLPPIGESATISISRPFTHREQFYSAMITPQVSLVGSGEARPARRPPALFHGEWLPRTGRSDAPRDHLGRRDHPRPGHDHGYADSFALIVVVLPVGVLAVAILDKGAAAGATAH